MSKPSSPSTTPEFATENDYSDILGKSTSPRQPSPSQIDGSSSAIVDPWAIDPPTDRVEHKSPSAPTIDPLESLDPWASDIPTETARKSPARAAVASPQPVAKRPAASSERIERTSSPAVTTVAPPQPESKSATRDRVEDRHLPTPQQVVVDDGPSITGRDLALTYCERGSKSLVAKDYAQARSSFKIAIEWNPKLALAHSGTAQVCYQIQDYEGALVAWDLAIGLDATQLDFYYQRALVHKALKDHYQVLADCKRVLEGDPEHPSARWLNAVAFVKTENYQVALSNLDLHIEAYPQDPNGYCYRGICSERLDKLPQALTDLDRAIALKSNQPVFHQARGRTRQKLGDLKGALADFTITLDRKPQASVYDDRSEVNRCLGNHLEALHDCDRAIELNPKFIEAYFRRGLTYTEMGDLELALKNYSATIDLDPQHINAHLQRSWTYFRQQDYRRTKQDCQTVKMLDRSNFWAYYLLGVVDSFTELKHNALKNFSTAIEISPNYVSARYHRGIVYHEMGDVRKAMADFEQARALQERGLERMVDRDETGFYAEGLALYHMGQPEAARTVLILGALSAKRFNNPSFHQRIRSQIEDLGMASGELSSSASNSCALK
jgi:tetratricopeptide (TPR) repeat protein